VGTIDVTQLAVAAYLYFGLHQDTYALVLLGLILPQIFFQFKFFLPDPIANDVKYQAAAQPFLVFGLLTTGLAVGHANAVAAVAGL
jgi:chlorophyll synthase